MYKVYADDTLIDGTQLSDYSLSDPTLEEEINEIPTFEFTMPCNHPLIEEISVRSTIITVYEGSTELFRGRVLDETSDFYGNLEVYCEGALGFLCDSIVLPMAYSGDVEHFLQSMLDFHNQCVVTHDTTGAEEDTSRKIVLGEVDSSETINVLTSDCQTVYEAITSAITDEIGGYFIMGYDGTNYVLNYYEELETDESTEQEVRYGTNLIDIEQYLDSADIITCLIPFGASISQGETVEETDDEGNVISSEYEYGENENGNNPYVDDTTLLLESDGTTAIENTVVQWMGNKTTIKGIDHSARNDGDQLKANSAAQGPYDAIAIKSIEGIELWGEIWGTATFEEQTVSDDSENWSLYHVAYWYLDDKIQASKEITLDAVDMHFIDSDVEPVKVGDTVHVYSKPHGVDTYMLCTKTHIELRAPENSTITLGATPTTLSGTLAKK